MSAASNSLTMTDWHSAAIAIPVDVDHPRDRREGQAKDAEIERLQRDLAKCHQALRQFMRVQSKPAKADTIDHASMNLLNPLQLRIVGYEQTLVAIRSQAAFLLEDQLEDGTPTAPSKPHRKRGRPPGTTA